MSIMGGQCKTDQAAECKGHGEGALGAWEKEYFEPDPVFIEVDVGCI